MVIKNVQRDRVLTGDHQVQDLSVARRAFGDVLLCQFEQIRLAGLRSHRQKDVSYHHRGPGAAARGPDQIASPARIQEIVHRLRDLAGLDHAGIVAEGHEIEVSGAPDSSGVFELHRVIGQIRRVKALLGY
jgi:hypothetical protein